MALAAAFVAIERRVEAPLLPFEVFRGTTLGIANLITAIIASIAFSQFFLLTLYLQQVLHYSAAQSGLAFTAIAGTVAVTSNVAQRFVTRFGARRVLATGLLFAAASEALLIRLPVHGRYVTDLLPSFILIGIGIGVSFVAVTIAALAGVPRTGRRHRLGAREHEPADRRGHRPRRDHDDCDDLRRPRLRGRLGRRRNDSRLPHRLRDARRTRTRRGSADAGNARRAPPRDRPEDRSVDQQLDRSGRPHDTTDGNGGAVLDRRVDDLLLHARGLVLVRQVLAGRGASTEELDAHTRELERVQGKLVEVLGGCR